LLFGVQEPKRGRNHTRPSFLRRRRLRRSEAGTYIGTATWTIGERPPVFRYYVYVFQMTGWDTGARSIRVVDVPASSGIDERPGYEARIPYQLWLDVSGRLHVVEGAGRTATLRGSEVRFLDYCATLRSVDAAWSASEKEPRPAFKPLDLAEFLLGPL
jgi:hypothetical protein